MSYRVRSLAQPFTKEYRVFVEDTESVISPWHDVPLYPNASSKKIVNMVVEIPRWSNAKLEINKSEKFNPIKQDIKNEKLRFVANIFPYKGYPWNYGAIPQTWEDPSVVSSGTDAHGDNDPLDVIEIGDTLGTPGEIKRVKVLGSMALLDEGEMDWKVIAIDVSDPLCDSIDTLEDVEKFKPGLLSATKDWFTVYKVPDGKPHNAWAFNGEIKDREATLDVIEETHHLWRALIDGKRSDATTNKISCMNVTQKETPSYASREGTASVPPHQDISPAVVEQTKWHFVSTVFPRKKVPEYIQ